MLKREKDKENIERIILSDIREKYEDYDKKSLIEIITPFTTLIDKKIVITADNAVFTHSLEDSKYGYVLLKTKSSKKDEIVKKLNDLDFSYKYHIHFIADNMKLKNELEDYQKIAEIKKELKIKNKSNKGNITATTFESSFYNSEQKEYSISISKRSDSIRLEELNGFNGYLFTAKLKDIVELYNSIGDSLFDYNVRYRVKDELKVDSEINKTLKENPELFWFYNNGITLVINDPDFKLSLPDRIIISNKRNKEISVINGAQTITAAANYYSTCGEDDPAVKKAKVVLRLINLADNDNFKAEVNKISIALNRQKSIDEQDIAYTFEFVEKLNNICCALEDDKTAFEIYKRGGNSYLGHNYSLTEFSKLAKCYLSQRPGIARNASIKLLNSTYDKEINAYVFSDNELYKNISNEKEFKKYYSPTNFANDLKDLFIKVSKLVKINDDIIGDIYNYGMWYFVAKTILTLNNGSSSDFSSFDFVLETISQSDQKKMVETFVEELGRIDERERLDSNDFKTEVLYEKIKDLGKMPEFEGYLKSKFSLA